MIVIRICPKCGRSGRCDDFDTSEVCPACEREMDEQAPATEEV